MSGGDWGLVGLGGSKYGPQKSDFFFFFKLVERYKSNMKDSSILICFFNLMIFTLQKLMDVLSYSLWKIGEV